MYQPIGDRENVATTQKRKNSRILDFQPFPGKNVKHKTLKL